MENELAQLALNDRRDGPVPASPETVSEGSNHPDECKIHLRHLFSWVTMAGTLFVGDIARNLTEVCLH